nr:methyltransferase domain-containing protein [Kofleriaceae bacterium]
MPTDLIVWERDGGVHRVRVPEDGLWIGRRPAPRGASYCTASESVSRLHCQIARRGGDWLLEDLGSANGSRVNGVLIAGPTPVRSGDVLLIGGGESGITAQLLDTASDDTTAAAAAPETGDNTQFARWDPVDKIRASYDIVAERYASELADDMIRRPFERGMFVAFVDLVRALGPGLVGDVGCGPGHVSKHLTELGLEMFGIDISQAMIAQARLKHPPGRFRIASMLDLPVPTGSWIGAVSLYATLHCDATARALAHAEVSRVVRAGGVYLHGFYISAPDQAPGSTYHLDTWFGHAVSLDTYFVAIETASAELEAAGFEVVACLVREPMSPSELPTRRCYMVGKRC